MSGEDHKAGAHENRKESTFLGAWVCFPTNEIKELDSKISEGPPGFYEDPKMTQRLLPSLGAGEGAGNDGRPEK